MSDSITSTLCFKTGKKKRQIYVQIVFFQHLFLTEDFFYLMLEYWLNVISQHNLSLVYVKQ